MSEKALQTQILLIAGLSGAVAVLLGAFSAHGLESYLISTGIRADTVTKRLTQFETGVRYHLFHSVVMLTLAAIPVPCIQAKRNAFRLIALGCFFFSGSLYALVLLERTFMGAITPIGGVCWIIGWIWIARMGRSPAKS